jgi:hypothetical protein
METEKTLKEIYMYVLGSVVVIGFFTTLIFMIQDGSYEQEVNMIIGALIGAFITVIGFFFGSSKGSSDKTALLSLEKERERLERERLEREKREDAKEVLK